MNTLQPIRQREYTYSHLIGTGGIGSGMFFKLAGDHNLGRNESRLGELVPFKDYCKLHIISHYVSVLHGSRPEGTFRVYPVGKIGNDEAGRRLYEEMKRAGMTMDHVRTDLDEATLFSVCFQYPDSTGGNMTTSNSASGKVTSDDIDDFFAAFGEEGERELILAVPEVPIQTRIRLLETGRKRGSYNAASVLSSEVESFRSMGGFVLTDLLSVNIDEARSIADIAEDSLGSREIVEACIQVLMADNPQIAVVVTDGSKGSYGYCDRSMEFVPSLKTAAVSTGGAGYAFFAGILTGLNCGLPFTKGNEDAFFAETPLQSAMELGTLLASLSVTSPDTIHHGADAETLCRYAADRNVPFGNNFQHMFQQVWNRGRKDGL
jgi:sugar/nucleoside kinase (ribokinase family)